ncbi:MAG: enoyl-CoA hydratase-related protein [Bacillota bacterium]|nr:enoyl-CoA hydratase-related protein [Bacillota bacterium]
MTDAYRGIKYETILAWVKDGIGFMKFNRPEVMNAGNALLTKEAAEVLNAFSADPEVRVILVHGDENVFCAGADLSEVQNFTAFEARDYIEKAGYAIYAIEDNHKPVITAVRGLALGVGLEIVLASDIRIFGENVTCAAPEINLGIIPGSGGTQRMPRNMSIGLAKQYILTGDFFDAQTAYRLGIANMVVPTEQVMEQAVKMANKLIKKAPLALREAKQAINMSMNSDIKAGCQAEQEAWGMLFSSEDQKEGMKAFMEHRRAVFHGR